MRTILASEPHLTFAQMTDRIPSGWDHHELTAISPRHFEAVVTSTVQVLVRGRYSGVLKADAHYVPVAADFSDLDEALLRALDPEEGERIAQRALEEIYASGRYTYAQFARQLADEAYTADRRARTPRRSADRTAGPAGPVSKRAVPGLSEREPIVSRRWLSRRGGLRAASQRVRGAARALALLPDALSRVRFRVRLLRSVVRLLATRRPLRVAVRRSWRLDRDLRTIIRDLVRLSVLAAYVDRGEQRWWPRLETRGDELVVASMPTRVEDTIGAESLPAASRVVWDHSRVGTTVEFFADDPAAGVLELGPTGTYEFVSMSLLAARQSSVVHRALRSVLND